MAKPIPDALQETGERRLAEWGVGPGAGVGELAGVMRRDSAADIAIAARLAVLLSSDSAELLQRLEREAADKAVRKAAKRALYRLEQRGIHPPVSTADAARPVALAPAIEGYVSAVDGRGDQLVWLVKSQPGGVAHLFAVINDPDGLREVALNTITRKALKAVRAELEQRHELRLVAVDWHYADFLIHRAFEWASARGTRMSGDYPLLRAQIAREAAPTALPPMAVSLVDPAAATSESALAESAALLTEPEFRTWVLGAEAVAPVLAELVQVKESPLVLNQLQQEERFEAVVRGAIEDVFSPQRRSSWSRRLYEMAYFFAVSGRPPRAAQAIAAARGLDGGLAASAIPVCAELVRGSLAVHFQQALQTEQERERSSLVLTPHQAKARRERDR
jgi:hypothetical protein